MVEEQTVPISLIPPFKVVYEARTGEEIKTVSCSTSSGGMYGFFTRDGARITNPNLLVVDHVTDEHLHAARLYERGRINRQTGDAWKEIKKVLQHHGFKHFDWSYNDDHNTHRRIRVSPHVIDFLVDNLSVWAIAEKYQVNVLLVGQRGTFQLVGEEDGLYRRYWKGNGETTIAVRIWPRE